MLNTYLAPGIAENVNFTLHPAVRPGTGLNSSWGSCPKGQFECPDEDCNCPYTRWELCSLHSTELDLETRIRFMTCYDSQNIPYSADWATMDMMPNAMQAAQSCAQSLSLNWTAIQTCGGNISSDGTYTIGAQSEALITEAAQYFYDTFPDNRGLENGMFHVPHLYINNQEQALNNLINMWNTTKQLCDNGASGAEVCDSVSKAKQPVWEGAVRNKVLVV